MVINFWCENVHNTGSLRGLSLPSKSVVSFEGTLLLNAAQVVINGTLIVIFTVVNQQSLVERLELIARQLGMTFTPPTTTENRLFLSSEMFAVEIVPDGAGGVKDVKIGHHENPVVCFYLGCGIVKFCYLSTDK